MATRREARIRKRHPRGTGVRLTAVLIIRGYHYRNTRPLAERRGAAGIEIVHRVTGERADRPLKNSFGWRLCKIKSTDANDRGPRIVPIWIRVRIHDPIDSARQELSL